MKTQILAWLVSQMLGWTLPPARHEAERARYETIAADALAVATDPDEKPLFQGPEGRLRTATLLLAIASFESSFARDVEDGRRRGDHGESACLAQIRLPGSARIEMRGELYGYGPAGWSKADLEADRRKCFRAALHIARESYRLCGNLSIYSTGTCIRAGEPHGTHRELRAKSALKARPEKWDDTALADFIEPKPRT